MRAQLAVPNNDLVSAGTYNQLFTLHGTMMMFLFAVPIFEAVAILILPQMLAARDLPFPRLSAFGFWCFLIGGVFVAGSIFFDAAPDGGWFMYPPLATDTTQSGIGADIWLLGLSFIEVASIAAAVELIVGVLKCRPPGMRINLMPLYCWYVLIVGGMILFAFPPLIAGDILFEMQRLFDWPFFDVARGGDPVLWQHLFWIFGHPEVYIIFLPSIALLAMIVPTFAQRPILGYGWIVLAAVGTGFLSFGLWAHHMFTIGLPALSLGFFSAASEAVAIPTGVQIFVFVATMLAGRVMFSIPMLFATGALAIFVFGGLTGVMVALAPFDWQAHDSYFVVAHLHYTLIGGMFFPLIAGVYYFHPFITGADAVGEARALVVLADVRRLQHRLPADAHHRPARHAAAGLHLSRRARLGLAEPRLDAGRLHHGGRHRRAGDRRAAAGQEARAAATPGTPARWNGWRAIPPSPGAYARCRRSPAAIRSGTRTNLMEDIDAGRFYLPGAPDGKRETLVTDVLDATPEQVLRVPGDSFKPMIAAVLIGGSFIATTFHWWIAALVSGVLGIAAIMVWLWTGTARIPEKPTTDAGMGLELPLYASGSASVGWWAMFITMVGDGTAFLSLVFAYFYYWTIHAAFPPEGMAMPDAWLALGAGAATLIAWLLMLFARQENWRDRPAMVRASLALSLLLALAGAALLLLAPGSSTRPSMSIRRRCGCWHCGRRCISRSAC